MEEEDVKKRIIKYLFFDATHPSPYLIKSYAIFLKDTILSALKNTPDFASEELHWRRCYNQKSIEQPEIPMFISGEMRKSIRLAIEHLQSEDSEVIDCLDVGCGPTSQFYTDFFKDNNRFNIISVDPLAEVYNELHERYNSSYYIKCLKGYGENLDDLFSLKKFHLIYTQNAIDHSKDPIEFIDSCYQVLKPGGILILHGFIKEGTAANWLGLHNWDIEVEKNDLLLTDKENKIKRHNLTGKYNFSVLHREVTGKDVNDMYTFIFKKIDE